MLAPLKEEAKKRQIAAGVRGVEGGRGHEKTLPPNPGEGFTEGRNRHATEAVAQAAKLVGVGKTAVQDAKAIVEQAPDLVPEIQSGRMSVDYTRQRNA